VKFFVLLIGLVIAVLFWRSRHGSEGRVRPGSPRPPPDAKPQEMVACVVCGTHIPRSEALSVGVQHYCGESHRRQAVQ